MHVAGDIAFMDQILVRAHLPQPRNERTQRLTVAVGQFLEALKLLDKRILHWATAAKAIFHPTSELGQNSPS